MSDSKRFKFYMIGGAVLWIAFTIAFCVASYGSGAVGDNLQPAWNNRCYVLPSGINAPMPPPNRPSCAATSRCRPFSPIAGTWVPRIYPCPFTPGKNCFRDQHGEEYHVAQLPPGRTTGIPSTHGLGIWGIDGLFHDIIDQCSNPGNIETRYKRPPLSAGPLVIAWYDFYWKVNPWTPTSTPTATSPTRTVAPPTATRTSTPAPSTPVPGMTATVAPSRSPSPTRTLTALPTAGASPTPISTRTTPSPLPSKTPSGGGKGCGGVLGVTVGTAIAAAVISRRKVLTSRKR